MIVDPFAGGGAIPLEALRVGADALASDLNPVAVLLNKVVLEYVPRHGARLADEVERRGRMVLLAVERELSPFYPKDPDGATPITYLWARTVLSEAPGQGDVPIEVPLIRSFWLAKKRGKYRALRWKRDGNGTVETETVEIAYVNGVTRRVKRPLIEIFEPKSVEDVERGTVLQGSATCPVTGFTTRVASVRRQLVGRHGGTTDARLLCVVTTRPGQQGRSYRLPTTEDLRAIENARSELGRLQDVHVEPVTLVPQESLDLRGIRRTSVMIYGLRQWCDFFTPRQALALTTLVSHIRNLAHHGDDRDGGDLNAAVQTCLALALDKLADLANSLCAWEPIAECPRHLFGRQAIPFTWDFGEGVPIGESSGSFRIMIDRMAHILKQIGSDWSPGTVQQGNATMLPLPDESADAFITDPPYYDAVPYAFLSDFFYVWLRRSLGNVHRDLLDGESVPKDEEIVVDRLHGLSPSEKDIAFYERELTKAFAEGRRVLKPEGIGTIVFASKTTSSWEAFLQAIVDAGLVITGSWPIETEMETRVSAQGQARLASSVHLVCRPREQPDGSLRVTDVGDWRDVLQELPQRIRSWMPRLAAEGVVGADAIFACLGPALEIFSRYSHVEKASGERVVLREYLEQVWAAVAQEALTMIFAGADATGFEADARLTAMLLWTLSSGAKDGNGGTTEIQNDSEIDGEDEAESAKTSPGGFALEFDAVRKIAQGLGAHLNQLTSIIEVKGDKARLLPVVERTSLLFESGVHTPKPRRKDSQQLGLFGAVEEDHPTEWRDSFVLKPGSTTLDRLHQSMILFGAGRSGALNRLLVEDGVGRDQRFWRLAQALSALYPSGSDEKRWVDGVLARKKGLGL